MRRLLLLVALLHPTGLASAQSLADVAKQTEEQRAMSTTDGKSAVQPSGKVYTNKDLGPHLGPPAAAPADKSTRVAQDVPAPASSVTTEEPSKKDEAAWRARMTALRGDLTLATDTRTAKETLVKRLEGIRDNVPGHGFSVAQAYTTASSELAKARAELDAAISAVKAAELSISLAREEARRAGVPPGWLR